MWLNAENLFLLSDQVLTAQHLKLDEVQWQKLSTSIFDNKPLQKAKHLAKIILDKAPDVIALCEVGGIESLKNFNSLFLGDTYSPALIEGNSDRNIDLGFLIKRDVPYYFDIASNRNRLLNFLYPHERENLEVPDVGKAGKTSHKFSRDVVELHLFKKDREKPFLVILAAHLKSRLDPEGIDPYGFQRRQAEMKALLEVYDELQLRFKRSIPVIIAGDLNGNASSQETDQEFKALHSTDLKDVGELAQFPLDKRSTYYQISRNNRPEPKQLDYCLLSAQAQPLLDLNSIDFYRYKDHLGQAMDPPTSLDAKLNLPSDHYPIYFELKNIVLSPGGSSR